ncbi:MAG TPA: pentapeptide repeat-containing protein [Bryobacteraceae bacterium]|nr:pentapeptide repeat-containing protein [Bryobacteraceae bacterium]
MKPKTNKRQAFQREKPDLPAEFESAEEPGKLFADPESVTIQEKRLQDLEIPNVKTDAFRLEGSVLERVQLAGGQFGSAVWKDVRLVGCDLANLRVRRITLVRVELVDCRLTGFFTTALDWQDVLIQNGDVRYAQFAGGRFRNCEFEGSNWQEADLQNADFAGCVFRSCNLGRADLHGAKLENADLRKSEVEGMMVGMNDLRGAIVDPAQAMILARLLGLQIR